MRQPRSAGMPAYRENHSLVMDNARAALYAIAVSGSGCRSRQHLSALSYDLLSHSPDSHDGE